MSLFGNDGSQPDGTSITPHNFLVGISIAVGTSFIQSLGLTIQRKSHVINEAIHPKELRRQACQRPLWHLGFHTYILSNLTGTIFSIGYLPVIILAPLGAVTLVFNALFARLLLGDVFSRQSAAGKKTSWFLRYLTRCCCRQWGVWTLILHPSSLAPFLCIDTMTSTGGGSETPFSSSPPLTTFGMGQ
jgi:hypothetical protein